MLALAGGLPALGGLGAGVVVAEDVHIVVVVFGLQVHQVTNSQADIHIGIKELARFEVFEAFLAGEHLAGRGHNLQ